jgi:hypothetical protein
MRAYDRLLAAFAASVLFGTAAASCQLIAGVPSLGEPGGTGGSAPVPCATDGDCDDGNPCTGDACGADKTCVFTPVASGPAPDEAQHPGDCKTIVCAGGAATEEPDDKDTQDDHEDCTIDTCSPDGPAHTAKQDNTPCTTTLGDPGVCEAGVCTPGCTPNIPCPDAGPCTTVTCDAATGTCVKQPLQDGTPTPGVTDTPGDCHTHVCTGGADMLVADDSDVPTVGDCDIPGCSNGTPSPTHKQAHVTCASYMGNQPGYCDGSGNCVQCTEDADCPGTTSDCQHPYCDPATFKCGTAFTPANTPTTTTPPQTPGDCQVVVCDGAGGVVTIADNNDATDDGNACTQDVCAGPNNTQHNPLTPGTACGNGLTCNSQVKCAGCSMNAQCPQASCNGTTLTKAQTCDTMGNCVSHGTVNCAPYLCNAGANACTTTCNTDNDCATGNYCTGAGGQCLPKLPQGGACTSNHQCTNNTCVDGFCCNSACTGTCFSCNGSKTGGANGTCAPITIGTDPDNECADQGAASCGTNGLCDGTGACQKYSATTQCAASSCAGTTLTVAKFCNGSGTCVTPNPATTSCAPGTCGGSPAACNNTCSTDANCASTGFCSGGMCTAKKTAGSTCPTGAHECTSGFCVDGYCCNTACTGACQACASALKNTGSNGVCGAAKDGLVDPRGLCSASPQSSCGLDGLCKAGACDYWPSTTACAPGTCSGSTITSAKSCDGFGSCISGGGTSACPGHLVCANGTSCLTGCGTSDANCTPSSQYYCDGIGAGTCQTKLFDGGVCSGNHQCTSGVCGVSGTGNCCSTMCATGGACGATGCDPAGACVYPTGSCTTCNPNTAILSAGSCNGAGSCAIGMSAPCPQNLGCQDTTQCWTSCLNGGNPDNTRCAPGYVCSAATGKCQ